MGGVMRIRIRVALLCICLPESALAATVPFGSQQVISSAVDNAESVFAADVDGDGDLDVLSASSWDDKIAWYENQGGQFALDAFDTAPVVILDGNTEGLLRIDVTHNGRSGDTLLELATLELLFEEPGGDPLLGVEANALIENLHVYRDDGSGVFESGTDGLVTTVASLSLAAGVQTVTEVRGGTRGEVRGDVGERSPSYR
jgi:hypothetical protein